MRDVRPSLNGARILLVEDDLIILMELESILVDAGAEIVGSCQSVNAALSAIAAGGPVVALLDIRLGRQSITPVARELVALGVPFAFYTGQVNTDAIRKEWPQCKVISKPSTPEMIVAAVADMLAQDSRTLV